MISRSMLLALGLALSFAPIGCDDEDGDSDTSNDSANDTSGNDSANDSANDTSGNDSAASSSSMETCVSMHECINDACVCTTPGMEDMECTDDEACVDECEVCM